LTPFIFLLYFYLQQTPLYLHLQSLHIGSSILQKTHDILDAEGVTVEALKSGVFSKDDLKDMGISVAACTLISSAHSNVKSEKVFYTLLCYFFLFDD
jgi:hypothetical protein